MSWLRVAAVLFQITALVLFIVGFFPPRVSVKKEDYADTRKCAKDPGQLVDKLVVMVIDGWREDFLFDRREHMRYVDKFLSENEAFAVTSHVQHPTVTMPRLKAVLAGIVPSYLDVVLNFASTEFLEDNWLKRAVKGGTRTLFYGDDTWIKMFPTNTFQKTDGVVSFFVTDYTEVDNNVTRHLENDLTDNVDSWDLMILHYLGLDHIGHSLGAKNEIINTKLEEMDRIIGEIYENLTKSSNSTFLLLVFGDHGMAELGGHGGSTYLETNVPVFGVGRLPEGFILNSSHSRIEQVDLAATLAAILNVGTPIRNLGVEFLTDVIKFNTASSEFLANVLLNNGYQLKKIVMNSLSQLDETVVKEFDFCLMDLERAVCQGAPISGEKLSKCKSEFQKIQSELLSATADYDYFYLHFGLVLSLLSVIIACTGMDLNVRSAINCPEYLLVLLTPLTCFASSYVEEEQAVWTFVVNTVVVLLLLKQVRTDYKKGYEKTKHLAIVFVLILLRFLPVIREKATELKDNVQLNFIFTTLTFLIMSGMLFHLHSGSTFIKIPLIISLLSKQFALPSSFWTVDGVLLAGFYVLLAHQLIFARLSDFLLFWGLSLASPTNILVLFMVAVLSRLFICEANYSPFAIYLSFVVGFYATGNTHSLATIDLSSAYSRLPFFHPVLVGLQLFVACYSGSIVVYLTTKLSKQKLEQFSDLILFCRAVSTFLCLLSLYIQRHHLFVWSVFAPKLVYEVLHFGATTVFLTLTSSMFSRLAGLRNALRIW